MKIDYLLLRFIRHFMPEAAARFLLKRRWIIKPGLESSDPISAVEQYVQGLEAREKSIQGKRLLLFGYGGRFAVGAELLRRGAAHVTLCDHFVLLDEERNRELLPQYADYLTLQNNLVVPRAEFITLLHGDIRQRELQSQVSKADFVLSTSVFEHLQDVAGITRALTALTAADGAHLHFVDLRDHYFKYPFEMLSYPENVWMNLLNPTSHLNRFRLRDYQRVFDSLFEQTDYVVLERQMEKFRRARKKIRPEFISGDELSDSVTLIQIYSERPRL